MTNRARARWRLAVTLGLALLCLVPSTVRAGESGAGDDDGEGHSRSAWAALLIVYTVLGAAVTGGAYVLRDNVFGRGIAISAVSWGGLGVGAAAGYGLAQLRTCETADCASEEAGPVLLGGFLGAAAGSLLATFMTSTRGLSRPETAAAGMAPALVYVSLGTILRW